ncbi:hypothetical protein J437_LFUL000066 [Ladona fulva]|uniref:Chloride channel protein n=1 Tax=Ladona fulva TaxID=123851 RepID=A0A8K0K016_LADFU|nr:hypothetical protein J437_LFUL000066 [Ladona fulva]
MNIPKDLGTLQFGPNVPMSVSADVYNISSNIDFPFPQMYGRYTKDLGEFAKEEARRAKAVAKARRKEDSLRNKELGVGLRRENKCVAKVSAVVGFVWKHTFARLGEDWVFLALLGLIMAMLSFVMDHGISLCNKARIWLYRDLAVNPFVKYVAWVSLPLFLILFSAGFVHIVAPQSIGSGIPEMKTILRGVALKEYLTFRTLVAKIIGLTATLGSGMPLGKEGPFVHIASIVATLLSKLVTSFQGIYENESRNSEMLAAACAVGVASCFGAPIGGVLFSIEVTTVYFAVRNYWRGFFAAVCGATVFRLLAVWSEKEATVTAVFGTNFTMDFPFDPQELIAFSIIGRFLYPGIVSLVVASVTFPPGLGRFMAADLNTHDQVVGLFTNFTWTKEDLTVEEADIVNHWTTPYTDVFVSLAAFLAFTFIFSIVGSTIPVPSGSFIPVFKIGAAFGRIVGEAMHVWFPFGVRYGGINAPIIPGGYATVGAAAFSGAVTHTISVSVIVFEMTGQITHIIPIMIAVLISNATASLLQPSLYDSIILIKKLPYLPDLLPSSSGMYNIYVEDFMVRGVKYIWHGMSYHDLKEVLKENRNLRSFPLVETPESMILLGSIQRLELIKLIDRHIGRERRLQVAAKWQKEAQERAMEEMERRLQEEEEERRQINQQNNIGNQRRPSRFEVIPAPDIFKLKQNTAASAGDLMLLHPSSAANTVAASHITIHGGEMDVLIEFLKSLQPQYHPVFGGMPKKSILKKTNSFNLRQFSPLVSPTATPYTTVTGAESRIRLAFEAIFRKSATLQDVNPDPEAGGDDTLHPPTPLTPGTLKKVQLPRERVIDMSPEDQKKWEEDEMALPVAFDRCHIDPAPFQLVERTSLLKVHSLFSMVGVNHAYVTAIGRLVGVVALKELRKAIEDANSGNLPLAGQTGKDGLPVVGTTTTNPGQDSVQLDPIPAGAASAGPGTTDTLTSMDSALSSAGSSTDDEDSVASASSFSNSPNIPTITIERRRSTKDMSEENDKEVNSRL